MTFSAYLQIKKGKQRAAYTCQEFGWQFGGDGGSVATPPPSPGAVFLMGAHGLAPSQPGSPRQGQAGQPPPAARWLPGEGGRRCHFVCLPLYGHRLPGGPPGRARPRGAPSPPRRPGELSRGPQPPPPRFPPLPPHKAGTPRGRAGSPRHQGLLLRHRTGPQPPHHHQLTGPRQASPSSRGAGGGPRASPPSLCL